MKVVVAGGTGLIGGYLTRALILAGHQVIHISRKSNPDAQIPTYSWEQLRTNPTGLSGVDAVVNLAGESINQRWNDEAKKRIIDSRVQATRAIANWVNALEQKPQVVVNGSAIGYYGSSSHTTFTEESAPEHPEQFLSQTGALWEAEADRVEGVRVVKLRTGLVLARDGGALPKMVLPYRLFAGGPVGSGKQWYSWIHIQDLVRLILFAIETPSISGPFNGTAPFPETSDGFGRAIGRVLKRPHLLPVPAFVFQLLFGEMATLLLDGQRVIPKKAQQAHFQFDFPTADVALQDLYVD